MKTRLLSGIMAMLLVIFSHAAASSTYFIDTPAADLYSSTAQYPDFTTETGSDLKNSQADAVYSLYDSLLAAYPEYVKKELLGHEASEENLPVYLYTFEPLRPASFFKTKLPTVFLTCGVHGREKGSSIVTYLLMKHLCEDWQDDRQLELLRHNVKFLIIPIANPYGWNHGQRQNANMVDINRNFPDGWTLDNPERTTYGGPTPFSEQESVFIRTVFQNNPDITMMFDFHNFFDSPERKEFTYIYATNDYTAQVFRSLSSSLTRKWRADFGFIPKEESYFAGRVASGTAGMIAAYANKTWNIQHAGVLEVCHLFLVDETSTPFNQDMMKGGVEALANFLLMSIRE